MEGVEAVVAEIDRRLAAARPPGSAGRITAADLREWAAEYLRHHDDEVGRIPDLAGCPHWNLWMSDARFDDAVFAVLAFWPDRAEFFCGTGNPSEVRLAIEDNSPDDPSGVYDTRRGRCAVPEEPLRLDRRAAEAWLGRPRVC